MADQVPCPCCLKGIGERRSTATISRTLKRRYYLCPDCKSTWTVDVRVNTTLESRNVVRNRFDGRESA